jgi:hypothetical protein
VRQEASAATLGYGGELRDGAKVSDGRPCRRTARASAGSMLHFSFDLELHCSGPARSGLSW